MENTHEPIASRGLWEQVQQIRDTSDKPKAPMFTTPTTENVFLRKVFCGHCGFSMGRRRYSGKIYGFVCSTLRLYAGGACGGAKITEAELRETLLRMLSAQESKITDDLSVILSKKQSGDTGNIELASVYSELEKNKLFFKSLYESLINGDITDTEYKEMKSTYEVKIAALTEQEKQLREADRKRVRQENELSKAQKSVWSLRNISDLTTEVVDRLVERIGVYEDKRIEVKFTFMDEIISGKVGGDNA